MKLNSLNTIWCACFVKVRAPYANYLLISFHGNFVDDLYGGKGIHVIGTLIGTGKLQMACRSQSRGSP